MSQRRLRVLVVSSHPVQYASPIFRLMAHDPRIESHVAYCTLQGAETQTDPDFGIEVKWDIPLLDGYPWVVMRNCSRRPRVTSFFGLLNLEIWSLIRRGDFDAVILFTGYTCATFWIAMAALKMSGIPVLFATDAHDLASRDGKAWKPRIKRRLWPHLFRLADVMMVPSSGGVELLRALRMPEDRIVLTPYSVNNEWWIQRSDQIDRAAARARWNVPENATIILFCAKLQPWKRPLDLLRAFARVAGRNEYLIFAGEGSLRPTLESEARSLGIEGNVRFLGFVNQSGLPEVYTAADIFVLPSEYEPFGVVVNESMLCRCSVIVSDRVGARFDLVREGTGFVFPVGDVGALATLLGDALQSPERLKRAGEAARERMRDWSPEVCVQKTVEAIEKAVQHRKRPKHKATIATGAPKR